MDRDQFKDPLLEYRPTQRAIDLRRSDDEAHGFRAAALAELARLKALGFGGVELSVSHDRYMESEAHWQTLREELAEVRRLGMRAWIRDDRGRPSGKAAGKVVARYPAGQARGLTCLSVAAEGGRELQLTIPDGEPIFVGVLAWDGDHLTLEGALRLETTVQNGRVGASLPPGRWQVVALVERTLTEGTFAHDVGSGVEPYINILDRRAVELFLETSHETYRSRIGEYFGDPLEGFHADEPMLITTAFPVKTAFPPFPMVPWLPDLPKRFARRYGYDLVERLPALFHDVGRETARIRCDFYRLIGELCGEAFSQPLADWCRANGVRLKHQPLGEESLVVHTALEGSIFPFLAPGHALCPDLLSTTVETFKSRDQCLPAPKIVSSVAHVTAGQEVIADFADYYQWRGGVETSFEQLRNAIGWLYALGADSLHHIGPWRERDPEGWRQLTAYVGRLTYALCGARHVADLAVLYPITTIWAHYVPTTQFLMKPPIGSLDRPKIWSETYAAEATVWELPFREIVWSLLEHQRDFDLIDDAALARGEIGDGRLGVGSGEYGLVIVPPMDVIDAGTHEAIASLVHGGGQAVAFHPLPHASAQRGDDDQLRTSARELFGDQVPPSGEYLVRGVGAGRAALVADASGLLRALDDLLPPDLALEPATTAVFYRHARRDDGDVYLVVNCSPRPYEGVVTVRAVGRVEQWDPLTGEVTSTESIEAAGGATRVGLRLRGYGGTMFMFGRDRTTKEPRDDPAHDASSPELGAPSLSSLRSSNEPD